MPFLALTQGIAVFILKSHGWPNVPIRSFGNSTGVLLTGTAILISNLPDFVSVIIYYIIWKHLKTPKECEEELPYGGIWVGEVFDDPIPVVIHKNNDLEHKIDSVMKALHWHFKLCLVDLALPILTIWACNKKAIYFLYPFQILCFYWVPFLVIKKGFSQLDGVIQHVAPMITSRIPKNNVFPDFHA